MEHIPLTVEISIQSLNLSSIFSDAGTSLLYRYDWRLGYPTVIGETGDCAKNLVSFLETLRMNNNAELCRKSCDELLMNEYKIYREPGSVQFGVILNSSFSR